MNSVLSNFKISVQDSIYNKDPESSELGKRIISNSIQLIDEMGFDAFTFKKLGAEIGSNESSIYRYFDNKHKLLVYLSSWYWTWTEYHFVMQTHSINDSVEKLSKGIEIVTQTMNENAVFGHINIFLLHKIIVSESLKSFLTKDVVKEKQEGYFQVYIRLVSRLKEMILVISPDYQFSASLASTILETALHQHFLKDHFPGITDCDKETAPAYFLKDLVFKTLNIK